MKKALSILLSVILTICVFSACAKQSEEATTETQTNETSTSEITTAALTEAPTTNTTTKRDEKPFDKWNTSDLVKYFKAEKVFTEEDYLGEYTDFEELPDGVSGEIEYNNHQNDEINVLIFYFEPNAKEKSVETLYKKIKQDKYFEWEEGGQQQPFNALIGRFAIFYSASLDENFVKSFEKALDKLVKEQNIKPDYYEKNIDLSKYKDGDDVIIIEADD